MSYTIAVLGMMIVASALDFALAWSYCQIQIGALKAKVKFLNTALSSLQETRSAMMGQEQTLKTSLADYKNQVVKLHQKIGSLESSVDRLDKRNQILIQEYKILENTIEEYSQEK